MSVGKISARDYLSIKDLELELEQANILKGRNNTGKSNILSIPGFFKTAAKKGNYRVPIGMMGGFHNLLREGAPQGEISLKMEIREEEAQRSFIWTVGARLVHSALVTRENMYESLEGRDPRVILENRGGDAWYISGGRRVPMAPESPDTCMVTEACLDPGFPGTPVYGFMRKCSTIRPQTSTGALQYQLGRLNTRNSMELERIASATREITGWTAREESRQPSPPTVMVMKMMDALFRDETPSLIVMDSPEWGMHPDCMIPLAQLLSEKGRTIQLIISTNNEHIALNLEGQARTRIVVKDPGSGTTVVNPEDRR